MATHTHDDHGSGPASWPTSTPDHEKYQHFHNRDGLGQPIWTGPLYPDDIFHEQLIEAKKALGNLPDGTAD